MTAPTPSIDRLLRPRSIAIIGASPTPGSLGASVLANLERAGYGGDIHLVNPKRSEIGGRPCVPTVDDLPEGVDCAVFAVPRVAVLPAMQACARRKFGSAVVFSAGFAEGGPEGLAEQAEIAKVAREGGMVLEGPNCLGAVNYVDGTPLTFVETPAGRLGDRRGIAIVSQSGAMSAVVSASLKSRHIGISFSVSTGNEAASGVEDYVEYLIGNAETQVITMVVEQFRQPARFLTLVEKARAAGKLIVLVHPGRSSAARESAATHTGAMAGDWQLMRSKVHHAGVLIVDTLEELLDVSELAIRCKQRPQAGAAVLVESGWLKALTLDLCEEIGLELPAIGPESDAGLKAALPDFIPPSNPLDLTAQALVDPDLYKRTLSVLLADPNYGSVVIGIILTDETTSSRKFPPIIDAIRTLKPEKPVIFAGVDEGAETDPRFTEELRALGVPFFPSPERAFRALARLTEFATRTVVTAQPAALALAPLPAGPQTIPEYRSKQILAELGIQVPKGRFAPDLSTAQAVAAEIGYPIVLKAQSADLSHKSDAGGVVLNLRDAEELKTGWAKLYANVAKARPELVLDGVLVEAMGSRGTELIVGARNDPEWGPVVLVGFGGILAELLRDVRLLPPNLSPEQIAEELLQLKGSHILKGYRGDPALDFRAAADIVSRVGRLMLSEPRIAEIDVNPVVLAPAGQGAVALDALIVLR